MQRTEAGAAINLGGSTQGVYIRWGKGAWCPAMIWKCGKLLVWDALCLATVMLFGRFPSHRCKPDGSRHASTFAVVNIYNIFIAGTYVL